MKLRLLLTVALSVMLSGLWSAPARAAAGEKKVVFVAGKKSHGYGSHEHYAGSVLLAQALEKAMPNFKTVVTRDGWPQDASVLEGADVVVMYADGGGGHPVNAHLAELDALAEKGVGVVCLHYGVEVPTGPSGEHFLKWIGGYFEANWSVNPHWTASFQEFPEHPTTQGVKPFAINDEWYYHMRFRDNMEGVTPILTDLPGADTLRRPDGAHSGNPAVREAVLKRKERQHVAWASERKNGQRGFGFTGGHFHWNWGDDNFRKVVLNAIVWAAHGEVPKNGVESRRLTVVDLEENQDEEQPKNFDRSAIEKQLNPSTDKQSSAAPRASSPAMGAEKPVYASPIITSKTPGQAVAIKADITGAKELYLMVRDAGNGFACDWADWAEPRLVGPQGEKKLTDLKWKAASSGFGDPHVNGNVEGKPLRIAGESVEYGLGVHANSVVAYDLPAGYTQFVARGGLDNGGVDQKTCGDESSVQFLVFTQKPKVVQTAAPAKGGSREPEDAVAGLDVADGLEAHLFASEPALKSLTNLDIDHLGRIWVCEVMNYRHNNGSRPEGDRILVLEDTTGDGLADKQTVFYQGRDIDSALGICVLGDKVIVSASPNVLVFTDSDGDLKPDKKELLFTKTGQAQHDHSAHSFMFGPDGKLYWNFGNTGQGVRDKNGEVVIDVDGHPVLDNGKPYYGGMPFRCNLDGSDFEVLAHNFRNNYEVAVDSFGGLWQSDNDDDGNKAVRINFVMEHGNYGYRDELTGAGWKSNRTNMETEVPLQHWHLNDPGVVPNLLQTGAGSPTGICVYEGDLLPAVFQNQVIHCDAGPNVVRAYPVKPDGAGYSAEIVNVLHGARDNWFRPADVCVAPDGSLFVTDWYDPGVGGHRQGDLDRGRLFRIAPPGVKYTTPKFDFQTAEGAAEALRNPNLEVRYLAWTALHGMGEKAEPALLKMAGDSDPRMRARAIWLLGKIAGREQKTVDQAAADKDPNVRMTAIRLARQNGADLLGLVKSLVKDPSPQVRRELAIALRGNDDSAMPGLWAELAQQHDGKDRWYLEALGIGAEGQWDACLAAWLKATGDKWDTPAGRDIIWRSRSEQTPAYLAKIIKSQPEAEQSRYFRAFDYFQGPAKDAALNSILGL
ncbi:PVC-type heme-binding CxxCH protein [Lignipirellula cremea]|uniref:NPCBM/NEW2 domain protein n=1 Tax=Lignipirellula cremea TaxID=2528010 RepID=A0A518E3W3_9BACT|nr:PVC-type heme-binding CxxCH protein [Lignipirellula cremea]QDU98733.1 NPCBM/NEW2 domain protein [Lignipirellula cremea]